MRKKIKFLKVNTFTKIIWYIYDYFYHDDWRHKTGWLGIHMHTEMVTIVSK